jgi:ComF family protein
MKRSVDSGGLQKGLSYLYPVMACLEQWIFPPICCLCGLSSPPTQDFCAVCIALLPWAMDRCFRCARPLVMGLEAIYCQHCLESPPAFDRMQALFSYEPPIKRMIAKLKFSGHLAYARILGTLLAQTLEADSHRYALPQALVPVPLHHKRWVERGFNQARELALVAHKTLKIPLFDQLCIRVKDTPAQSSLDKAHRKTNLRKAFRIQTLEPLALEHVAIIDDVVTTGSTVDALAALLKDAGVEQVDVWCIARA